MNYWRFIMKKLSLVIALLICFSFVYGDGHQNKKLEDGVYFASAEEFSPRSGWKEVLTIVVKGGKVTMVDWNAANVNGGPDKKSVSKSGKYGMKAKGNAVDEWHIQAQRVEKFYMNSPQTIPNYTDDEGHSDTITGATINIGAFYDLVEKAIMIGPVGYGPYKDGNYYGEGKEFSKKSGWKDTGSFTVISGYIVAANWNAIHKDGAKSKKQQSKDGKYGMKEKGGAKEPWFKQAMAVEKYLIMNQKGPKGSDAIAGASISIEPLFMLAEEVIPKR